MGFFLRRMVGDEADSLTREQLEEVAEGALAMQEQLGRDVLSLVEMIEMPADHAEKDQRVVRARETVKRLGI
ncbi:MAG TPA: hypothetical protein VGV90_15835 [Solirubrobacteraceae bacterium]|nr:hypothetical protein [Solirubrobacteraceae bacterium]